MKKYWLNCIKCNENYPLNKDILTCKKHSKYYGYLTVVYDYKSIEFLGRQSKRQSGWNKYLPLLPVRSLAVNFNEQKTPLIKAIDFGRRHNLSNLYIKDESKNTTGSFKDKESICVINKAIEWGIDEIFVVSSGNAAVSTAAYAQKAKIKCKCIISENLTFGKKSLINLYKGKLIEKKGNYEDMYKEFIDTNEKGWNCTPGINPIKDEGVKIIGFEIWEEIGVPDTIVVPCGNGTLLYGIYKAFKELKLMGLTDKLPKLVGVQVRGAAPLKNSFDQKRDYVKLGLIPDSVAEGIIAQESYASPKVMLALSETNGCIVEVAEKDIIHAIKNIISTESLIPEPTSAVVYAAMDKIKFKKRELVVLVQSAGGVKNLEEIVKMF